MKGALLTSQLQAVQIALCNKQVMYAGQPIGGTSHHGRDNAITALPCQYRLSLPYSARLVLLNCLFGHQTGTNHSPLAIYLLIYFVFRRYASSAAKLRYSFLRNSMFLSGFKTTLSKFLSSARSLSYRNRLLPSFFLLVVRHTRY